MDDRSRGEEQTEMSTSTAPHPAARSAFSGLIDYAGLFPPAQLSLAQAVEEYERERVGTCAWMLGRFILPASLLEAEPAGARGPLSVILDVPADPRQWFDALQGRVRGVAEARAAGAAVDVFEVPLPKLLAQRDTHGAAIGQLRAALDRGGLAGIPTFVEIPRDDRWAQMLAPTMEALARLGFGAKIRCGGATPDAFPSVDDVVAFVSAAVATGVAFKATAGLHHPVRGHVGDGAGRMHGFLNILAAAAVAPRAGLEMLSRIVAEEDAAAFRFDETALWWREERIGDEALRAARRAAFVSYGSCSFSEPVEDLTALGLLGPA